MSAAGLAARNAPARAPAAHAPAPAAFRLALRLGGLLALLCIALARWFALLGEDGATGRAIGFAVLAAAGATALTLTPRLPHRAARIAARAALVVVLLLAALLVGGIPLRLITHPHAWDTLGAGIGDGLSALPGVNVPYRGANEWVRIMMATGGCLLATLAGILAGWPGRRAHVAGPLVVIGLIFGVPAVQLASAQPWLLGAAFAVPLLAFALAERLTVRLAPLAAALVAAAVAAGLVVAPSIDAKHPVIDVQKLADALEPAKPDVFDWNHGYGPLDWPRDGHVLLRVQARHPAYWKAENLEQFDGTGWRVGGHGPTPPGDEKVLTPRRQWRQRIRVTIGGMDSPRFIGAGETLSIDHAPHRPVASLVGGFASANGDLGHGDAYFADVYTPRPTAEQMRAASQSYAPYLGQELSMEVPGAPGPPAQIDFPGFHTGGLPHALGPGVGYQEGVAVLDRAGYGRMYRLAQRLAAQAATPYDFARAVERYLGGSEFLYDEKPPASRLPLPDFLFKTHRGYCQHFSGAMALLMRMGGVPARVAAGFTPGELDQDRGEYVVRDIDAHSWVEVWFDGIGWVTFDPTPPDAPARAQETISAGTFPAGDLPHGGGVVTAKRGADLGPAGNAPAPGVGGAGGGDSSAWLGWAIAGGLLALAAAFLAARALLRRRLGHPAVPLGWDPTLGELERALRRTGRRPAPGTTLTVLERRLAGSPEARDYLRAVRAVRYAGAGSGPTAAQRRALRRELASGLGAVGRLRALWALPPRRPRRRLD